MEAPEVKGGDERMGRERGEREGRRIKEEISLAGLTDVPCLAKMVASLVRSSCCSRV